MLDSNLNKLSSGEVLWVERKLIGLNQGDRAVRMGLTRNDYGRLERDYHDNGRSFRKPLPPALLLRLARRRSGLSLAEVAEMNKVSRVTLLKWERIEKDKLKNFWERRGFTFDR